MQGVQSTPSQGQSSEDVASESISLQRAEIIRVPGLNTDTEAIELAVRSSDKEVHFGKLVDTAKENDKGLITIISLWKFVLGAISKSIGEHEICLDHVRVEIQRSPPGMEANPVLMTLNLYENGATAFGQVIIELGCHKAPEACMVTLEVVLS